MEVRLDPPDEHCFLVCNVVHCSSNCCSSRFAGCGVLAQCLDELAEKYPNTKFVKIVSTECIKNYPDRNLPTILVYNNSAVKATLVGLQQFGGPKCTHEGQFGAAVIVHT